ncbi:unnamed protein product, partial [Rotaria magnacalcarata]
MKIWSTYQALHDELALNNGYLLAFVEAMIRRQLHLVYTPRVIKPALPETDTIVLRVPYYEKPSQIYTKRVTVAAAKLDPSKKMRVDQNFSAKDQILTELELGAVYETICPECNDKYIGKTCRHLKTRIYTNIYLAKKRPYLRHYNHPT